VEVPLTAVSRPDLPGKDHLEAFLYLGPKLGRGEPGFPLILARGDESGLFDRLFIEGMSERGRVEEIDDEEMIRFHVTLSVDHLEGDRIGQEEYVLDLTVETGSGSSRPGVIRVRGHSSRVARLRAGGRDLTVLLADGDSDGVFGAGDPWTVQENAHRLAEPFSPEASREVGDFAWAGGRAWRLALEGTGGRTGRLVRHEPGITEEEDGAARDLYARDRRAPRAAEGLACEKGGDGSPLLMIFDAPWCAPCRAMERLVFSSEAVVEAARGIRCIRVDADSRPDRLEQHGITGLPAGILFDEQGRETGRYEGYRGVGEMSAFLRSAAR
jgi:thiol-disulfide isomerase/thioredoxin